MTSLTLAHYLDSTVLAPQTRHDDIVALCAQARELGVYAVCVSPTWVEAAAAELAADETLGRAASTVKVASVVGFPSGAHLPHIKAMEALAAVRAGANELDMVINIGAALDGDWALVERDIAAVRTGTPDSLLKVIFETALMSDEQIITACKVAESAGADYVKTSTGMHAAGGATVHAVELMAKTVDGRLGVKASGGVRDTAAALAFIDAGATRLGTSSAAAILSGDAPAAGDY